MAVLVYISLPEIRNSCHFKIQACFEANRTEAQMPRVTTEMEEPERRRLVFLTGACGSGKTSVAERLRPSHGFVHFDGDAW
uniref:Uncharacterized protein n=1 Tax=Chromera velia CCMP2878 TaxID=1169474 RepID=A0A0G4HBG6_9ALVE|eukprot:Cvel_25950.t1-p1 / transcript=Cvel_25950.t1 / gene=Cvel_25950 / organism=Chromera_velia_CCMP2878 / gene_product=hypothetical protein / transcript_product=hypothetical protein / location=Cvel_scaffold3007:5462-5701(-) / protein_length=80 / sequence_SO=supercontig / SO=protein_coding / is_pseudo=false